MGSLVETFGATEFESVAIAAPTLALGMAWLAEKTSVAPVPVPSGPEDWCETAILRLTDGSVIELCAPNPDHRPYNALKARVAELDLPEVLHWSISVKDLDRLDGVLKSVDRSIGHRHRFESERAAMTVGYIGPGVDMVYPFSVQWERRPTLSEVPQSPCIPTQLILTHREVPPFNRTLDAIGLRIRATPGQPAIRLELDTPKGPVSLESGRIVQGGFREMWRSIRLWFTHHVGSRR
jgi:hypothetical protein